MAAFFLFRLCLGLGFYFGLRRARPVARTPGGTRRAGVSPLQFRARKRLEAARVLLQRGEMTGATIARNLGYNDEAHFSKAFKRATGCSPRAWKQNN